MKRNESKQGESRKELVMKIETVKEIASKRGISIQANITYVTLLTDTKTIQLNLTVAGNVGHTRKQVERICDNLSSGRIGIQRK